MLRRVTAAQSLERTILKDGTVRMEEVEVEGRQVSNVHEIS